MYASDSDDWHVPIYDGSVPENWYWFQNPLFVKIIAMKGRKNTEEEQGYNAGEEKKWTLPKDYKCPTDRRTVANGGLFKAANVVQGVSYAMNAECLYGIGRVWYRNVPGPGLAHCLKTSQVVKPADKIFFIDGQWFAVCLEGSDYKRVWDKTGDKMSAVEWNTTAYRHSEGANIAFYDGHVKWMPKEQIYPHPTNKLEQKRLLKALWYPNSKYNLDCP